ncbi:MAG: glycerophosphodiester phosphodiesterase family protein [Patescibacteria group bacterium]
MIIFGHRGARGLEPENTLLSFRTGRKYTDKIELDVYACKTGELVSSMTIQLTVRPMATGMLQK